MNVETLSQLNWQSEWQGHYIRDVKRGSKNRNSFQNRVLEIDFQKS